MSEKISHLPQTRKDLYALFPDVDPKTFPETFVFIKGRGNPALWSETGKLLGKRPDRPCTTFNDTNNIRTRIGEDPRYPVNVRGQTVFVSQCTQPNPDVKFAEMEFIGDAARRANAEKIIALMSHMDYAREDRKSQPRMPISIAVKARNLVNNGYEAFVTLDIHSPQAQGTTEKPWDDIPPDALFAPYVRERRDLDGAVILAPDGGAEKRAKRFIRNLGEGYTLAIASKERDFRHPDTSRTDGIHGDVRGKPVIIPDDMIATGGTIFNAAELAKKEGATKVIAMVTHDLEAKDKYGKTFRDKLEVPGCPVDELVTTNSIAHREDPKVTELSIAGIFAIAILSYMTHQSLSNLLIEPEWLRESKVPTKVTRPIPVVRPEPAEVSLRPIPIAVVT